MSHSQVPELAESIDQIIQSGQSLSAFEQTNPPRSDSNLSINRTIPLPPLPSSSARSPKSRASSPRHDQTASSLRSHPLTAQFERHGTMSNRVERDNASSKKGSSKGDDEASRSSKSETLAGTLVVGSSGNNSTNITDFFGSEVFQIVIHNPTTAHRVLKFCQSRACGENMEFLQKVSLVFYLSSLNLIWLLGRCRQPSSRRSHSDPLHNPQHLYLPQRTSPNQPTTLPHQAPLNGYKTNDQPSHPGSGKYLR